jgi:hypothetical protein
MIDIELMMGVFYSGHTNAPGTKHLDQVNDQRGFARVLEASDAKDLHFRVSSPLSSVYFM